MVSFKLQFKMKLQMIQIDLTRFLVKYFYMSFKILIYIIYHSSLYSSFDSISYHNMYNTWSYKWMLFDLDKGCHYQMLLILLLSMDLNNWVWAIANGYMTAYNCPSFSNVIFNFLWFRLILYLVNQSLIICKVLA